jgi:hypothetical protein
MLLKYVYFFLRFVFKALVPPMQKARSMLDKFLFFCFFIWELLGLKKHRHSIFFMAYLAALVLLWTIFYIFMFRWIQGVYNTYYSGEHFHCMLLFLWLTVFHFLFSEGRRFLRHFLEDYIIYDEDWEWEQDLDHIEDFTAVRDYFKHFVIENKLSMEVNEKKS